MIRPKALAAIICTALLAHSATGRAEDPPPIFAKKTFDEARKETVGTDKILVVKATAVWCPPCKQMDKTTWRDDKVIKWFEANGLAIQIDVDKQRDVARTLEIEAMPTMVAFKKGEEFDRVVGYQDADELLAWLAGVKAGKRRIDKVHEKLKKAEKNKSGMSAKERLEAARELTNAREYDKATEEYVWLWKNIPTVDPPMGGVRASFMASDMQGLAAKHAPAMKQFKSLRDDTEKQLAKNAGDRLLRLDWITLNEIVGQDERTLKWFDKVKDDSASASQIEAVAFRLEQLLEAQQRWADFARLVRDPLAKLREDHDMLTMTLKREFPPQLKEHEKEIRDMERQRFREGAGKLYGGMLAAKRDDDATKVAAEAIRLDDSGPMRVSLVEWALRMKQARKEQAKWLEEAGEKGEAVEGLRKELDDRPGK